MSSNHQIAPRTAKNEDRRKNENGGRKFLWCGQGERRKQNNAQVILVGEIRLDMGARGPGHNIENRFYYFAGGHFSGPSTTDQ